MKYNVDFYFKIRYEVEADNADTAEDTARKIFDADCAVTENFPFDIPDIIEVEEIK